MIKKLSLFAILIVLIANLGLAQERVQVPKKPLVFIEPTGPVSVSEPKGNGSMAASFFAVDTMGNTYGPAIAPLNPFAYDPYADIMAIVYRGATTYAAGTGELWYSHSQDGTTWTRTPASINSLTAIVARYPSMAISNGSQSTNLDDVTAAFSWPQLNPGAFGFVGFGVDQPIGSGQTYAAIDEGPPAYSSQVPTFTSDNSDWIFWTSDNSVDAALRLWRTQDYATIDVIDPPQWGDAVFESVGNITLGGTSHNGVLYYGSLGTFDSTLAPNPIVSGWYPGYSKSTDDGLTWSEFNVCDFRDIPALSRYVRLFDYKKGDTYVSYEGDINVNKDGLVHMLIQVTDTVGSNNTGVNALVEIFEDPAAPSGWDAKIIYEGFDDNLFTVWTVDNSPGIGQMGPSGHLAFDKDREILFAKWGASATGAATDTIIDIYYSWRTLDGEWETPVNLTNTPNINEAGSHLAPMMKKVPVTGGYDVTAYVMYWYEEGNTTPIVNPLARTVIYVSPVTFFIPSTSVDDGVNLNSFELAQNYPNPFNPSTSINYSLAERSNVSIKVFDMLGREVANLVNTVQEAGSYDVTFNASNLASGMYVYSITAGNFTSSKKMMLLK